MNKDNSTILKGDGANGEELSQTSYKQDLPCSEVKMTTYWT